MNFEYQQITTADQSPSMSLPPTWEPMHSRDGAFTETQYIYQPAVEWAFQLQKNPAFISLGLGLAYNEILIAYEALKLQKNPARIHSYELVPELREGFLNWFSGQEGSLNSIYDAVNDFYAQKDNISGEKAKKLLHQLWQEQKLILDGPLTAQSPLLPQNHCILFDAFCAKTSPDLWTPEFLEKFFKNTCAESSVVSTYACTGALKRALSNNGFQVTKRKGFGFKKESTWAIKTKP